MIEEEAKLYHQIKNILFYSDFDEYRSSTTQHAIIEQISILKFKGLDIIILCHMINCPGRSTIPYHSIIPMTNIWRDFMDLLLNPNHDKYKFNEHIAIKGVNEHAFKLFQRIFFSGMKT